jgi:hypothetical protein
MAAATTAVIATTVCCTAQSCSCPCCYSTICSRALLNQISAAVTTPYHSSTMFRNDTSCPTRVTCSSQQLPAVLLGCWSCACFDSITNGLPAMLCYSSTCHAPATIRLPTGCLSCCSTLLLVYRNTKLTTGSAAHCGSWHAAAYIPSTYAASILTSAARTRCRATCPPSSPSLWACLQTQGQTA